MAHDFLTQEEINTLLGKKEKEAVPAPGEAPGQFTPDFTHKEEMPANLDAVLDFPLQVSVRLGEAKKTLQEIRHLNPGAVVELNHVVQEPLDVLIGGKMVARGEVIIIDESYGIKITEIMDPVERIKKLR